ncbi:hypothetical protein, partial [Endothiovibrio diazotrophicus]
MDAKRHSPPFLDCVRDAIRVRHYSYRTEQTTVAQVSGGFLRQNAFIATRVILHIAISAATRSGYSVSAGEGARLSVRSNQLHETAAECPLLVSMANRTDPL